MKIHLPNSAFLGNIDTFLKSFDPSNPDELIVTSNPKWLSVHPVVLAMLGAIGLTVNPSHITFENLTAKSAPYLHRMQLFTLLGMESNIDITEHESAGRFVPLTQIRTAQEQTKFITEMIPLLHLNPKHTQPIVYIVGELVRNVLEHSQSEHGAIVAAQYFKKTNRIAIGIADTGIGIQETISQVHTANSALEAMRLAMIPGITGTTAAEGGTEENAGAGLFFIKSIAKVNRDFFLLYSSDAMFKLLKTPITSTVKLFANPFKDKHSTEENLPHWNGTVVGVDITLDQTQEFTVLLDLIRKTYSSAIAERRKSKYKSPRFV